MTDFSNFNCEELLRYYSLNPNKFWEEKGIRQARKLDENIKLLQEIHDCSRESLIDKVIEAVKKRQSNLPPTIFLISAGSSGSHWLESVISYVYNSVSCGEVYFPEFFYKQFKTISKTDICFLIEGVHMLHSKSKIDSIINSSLINSSHLSGWKLSSYMPQPKIVIFLVRNLEDIVVSRTYRKPKYRKFIAPNLTDNEYLQKNIDYTKIFFDKSVNMQYDLLIRYEDLIKQLDFELYKIGNCIQSNIPIEEIKNITVQYSKELQSNPDMILKTNLNKLEKTEISMSDKSQINNQLGYLIRKLGY